MARGAELTMLEMSVLRPSIVPPAGDQLPEQTGKLLEFNKLRGKAKTNATEHVSSI